MLGTKRRKDNNVYLWPISEQLLQAVLRGHEANPKQGCCWLFLLVPAAPCSSLGPGRAGSGGRPGQSRAVKPGPPRSSDPGSWEPGASPRRLPAGGAGDGAAPGPPALSSTLTAAHLGLHYQNESNCNLPGKRKKKKKKPPTWLCFSHDKF